MTKMGLTFNIKNGKNWDEKSLDSIFFFSVVTCKFKAMLKKIKADKRMKFAER